MSQPSTFATLLRRSKFSSYDPAISQIYTAPPAHAYRGDFGFKRPLPRLARKRFPTIVVSRVDTREHQTEWDDAENHQKWLARMDEINTPVSLYQRGSSDAAGDLWSEQARQVKWDVDSEFDSSPKDYASSSTLQVTPNVRSMTPRKFEQYLEQLRKLRPEFRDYISEYGRSNRSTVMDIYKQRRAKYDKHVASYKRNMAVNPDFSKPEWKEPQLPKDEPDQPPMPVRMYEWAQTPSVAKENANHQTGHSALRRKRLNAHRDFLSMRSNSEFLSHGPPNAPIAPFPHIQAGLSYHHPSLLQNVLTTPPVRGHALPGPNESGGKLVPPSSVTVSKTSKDFMKQRSRESRGQNYYIANLAGSIASEISQEEVFTEATGSERAERRAVPFNWFPNRSAPPSTAPGVFRVSVAELTHAPRIVANALPLNSTQTRRRGEERPSRLQSINQRVKMESVSWRATDAHMRNPHTPGTPAYIDQDESMNNPTLREAALSRLPTPEYSRFSVLDLQYSHNERKGAKAKAKQLAESLTRMLHAKSLGDDINSKHNGHDEGVD